MSTELAFENKPNNVNRVSFATFPSVKKQTFEAKLSVVKAMVATFPRLNGITISKETFEKLSDVLDSMQIEYELIEEILFHGHFKPLSHYKYERCYPILLSKWSFYSSMTIGELGESLVKFLQMKIELENILEQYLIDYTQIIENNKKGMRYKFLIIKKCDTNII